LISFLLIDTTGTAITFINDKDQHKFAAVEQLIGKEVPKLPLPESLGAGPTYDPSKRSFSDSKGGRPPFRGRRPNRK
jgi:superfamily II DNA/RNA helicase